MWNNQHILGRTLIWLAAVAIPLQGLPKICCGCQEVGATRSNCCRQKANSSSCCAARKAERSRSCRPSSIGRCPCTGAADCPRRANGKCHDSQTRSCCSKQQRSSCCAAGGENCCQNGSCACGPFCGCKAYRANELPPVAPPTSERMSSDQVASSLLTNVSTGLVLPPPTVAASSMFDEGRSAATSLSCCIRLSRLML